jgi:hypothetical protein
MVAARHMIGLVLWVGVAALLFDGTSAAAPALVGAGHVGMVNAGNTVGVASAPAPALRIMPVGDSITQWNCGALNAKAPDPASFGGYRG